MNSSRVQVGRVFGSKEDVYQMVRITKVLDAGDSPRGASVAFEIWNSRALEKPWFHSDLFVSRENFERRYHYLPEHVLNQRAELEEAQYMLNCATRTVADSLAAVIGAGEAARIADLLVNVTRREAALRIAVHDWDEGCAAGCCDDARGAEKAADLIMTTVTETERTELLNRES